MSKKQEFVKFVEDLINNAANNGIPTEMNEDAELYWNALKSEKEVEKPLFTDSGKQILQWMRDNQDQVMVKSRDIAEGLFISSRAISGSMRKLVSDGFVEKVSQNPIVYTLTEKGKNIEIV